MNEKSYLEKQTTVSIADQSTPTLVNTRYGKVEMTEFGKGPAVITLHGAMGGYDQSALLARTIGMNGYRYINVSRPGYLGTPLKSGKSSIDQAHLCTALMDELGIPDALVMAVSGGGPCALQFALHHSQRCRGLVLASTCGGKIHNKIPFHFKLTMQLMRFKGLARAMEKKASESTELAAARSIPDPVLREQTLNDPGAGPLLKELLLSTSNRMAERIPGTKNDIEITRITEYPLEQISVPTLIIHGTGDSVVSYSPHAEMLKSRIPGAEIITIPDGEHVSIFTHRSIIQPKVNRFLQEHS
jgi:pimeloyl-ACP methyl ester carboxylesterase